MSKGSDSGLKFESCTQCTMGTGCKKYIAEPDTKVAFYGIIISVIKLWDQNKKETWVKG